MSNVYVLGSQNIDLVSVIDRIPNQGETLYGQSFSIFFGGKGANQAVAAAKLASRVIFCGCVGNDAFGSSLVDNLKNHQIDVAHVHYSKKNPSGTANILISNQDNRIIIHAGANHDILLEHVKRFISQTKKGDILVTQAEIPFEINKLALELAKEKSLITIHNSAPANKKNLELLQDVDFLILNESELFELGESTDINKSLNHLFKQSVRNIILTKGAKGFVWMNKKKTYAKEAARVKVVDTTGAGDAFCGAFAAFLSQGMLVEQSLDFAAYVGTMAVRKLGAQSSYPTMQELLEFVRLVERIK